MRDRHGQSGAAKTDAAEFQASTVPVRENTGVRGVTRIFHSIEQSCEAHRTSTSKIAKP